MIKATARAYYKNLTETLAPPARFALDAKDRAALVRSEVISSSRDMVALIDEAQSFTIEDDAARLLTDLVDELGMDAAEMMKDARLPFDTLWLERIVPDSGQKQAALIVKDGDDLNVMFFAQERQGHFSPALQMMRITDAGVHGLVTPHYKQAMLSPDASDRQYFKECALEQQHMTVYMTVMAKMMAVLMNAKGMLEVDTPQQTMSRADRRRAERRGETLPVTRNSKIRLGEFGRGQLMAMKDTGAGKSGRRRAHWVRGHVMRTAAGDVTWRNPHVRGAGPLIKQERRVVADGDDLDFGM